MRERERLTCWVPILLFFRAACLQFSSRISTLTLDIYIVYLNGHVYVTRRIRDAVSITCFFTCSTDLLSENGWNVSTEIRKYHQESSRIPTVEGSSKSPKPTHLHLSRPESDVYLVDKYVGSVP